MSVISATSLIAEPQTKEEFLSHPDYAEVTREVRPAPPRYRNEIGEREIIPRSVIEKPPSAELRANQKDTDSLPDYDTLDGILHAYIELEYSVHDIVGLGYEEKVVRRVIGMVDRAEYKRRQAAIGIRVTTKAFGTDRRLPITNRYSEADVVDDVEG